MMLIIKLFLHSEAPCSVYSVGSQISVVCLFHYNYGLQNAMLSTGRSLIHRDTMNGV